MHSLRSLPALLLVLLLTACYNPPRATGEWLSAAPDSTSFLAEHHYTRGYNFVVAAESIELVRQSPDELPFDSAIVPHGGYVVVADIMAMPADSIDTVWVKLAQNAATQGWLRECDLLDNAVPDDPISQFISTFSDVHLLWFLALLGLTGAAYLLRRLFRRGAPMVHFAETGALYPTLLTSLVAFSAVWYSSIQLFAPDKWQHYYFNPSLWPFDQAWPIALFLVLVWAIVVVALAATDEVVRMLPAMDAALYLCSLAAVCAAAYVVFSVSTLFYLGYALLPVYIVWSFKRMRLGHPKA